MTVQPLLSYIRSLSPPAIEALLGRDHVFRRAQQYVEEDRIAEVWVDKTAVRAHVTGSSSAPYHCLIQLHDGHLEPECSCPYARGVCWHVGAVLLMLATTPSRMALLEELAGRAAKSAVGVRSDAESTGMPASTAADESPSSVLLTAEALRDQLLALPKDQACLLLAEACAASPGLQVKALERLADISNLDIRLFRHAARAALRPGQRLSRFETPRVAADIEEIAQSTLRLVRGGHAEAALDLLLEVAWMAWHRLDETDDRDGALTATVRRILEEWIRGWSDVASRDRLRLARELFGWVMEDAGSITGGLILSARVALGPMGLEALTKLLRPLHDVQLRARAARPSGDETSSPFDPLTDRIRAALRETADARGNLDEFIEFCDADGRHGPEVLAAAQRLANEDRASDALRWVEKGRRRARGTARADLEDLRIVLLTRLDRRREAIEASWDSFLAEPGPASYRRLLGVVGEADRGEWRRRALDHAEASADATAFVEVALEAGDVERIAHRLDNAPGYVFSADGATLERTAIQCDERIPWAASRLHLHLAGRWLAGGDARYYGRARHHLQQARRAAESGGDLAAWNSALERLREAHAVVRAWFGED